MPFSYSEHICSVSISTRLSVLLIIAGSHFYYKCYFIVCSNRPIIRKVTCCDPYSFQNIKLAVQNQCSAWIWFINPRLHSHEFKYQTLKACFTQHFYNSIPNIKCFLGYHSEFFFNNDCKKYIFIRSCCKLLYTGIKMNLRKVGNRVIIFP